MKVDYDWDENTKTCTCQVCGYKYTEDAKGYSITEDGEPFIEMDIVLHSNNNSIYSNNSIFNIF